MGDWQDLPLPDGSYSDSTRPWSHQDVVGYLPTYAESTGTRSKCKYAQAPGPKPFAVVGDGPHRGARDVEGKAFVVSGNQLYQMTVTGIAIPLGTIPGTGLVSMTHNQIAGGNELVIGTKDNSYVYNTVTEVLVATGMGLSSVDFLGQYIVGVSAQRRFGRHSALADALTYSDLDVYSAEASPDRLVGSIVSQSEWLLVGERTIEPFSNTPTENAAFQRIPGATVERGAINGNTLCRLDNSVFFVDNNFIPCRLNGYTPVPIASKAIVDALSGSDPSKIFAFTWEDKGYVVYYVTCQDGQTWGYDVTASAAAGHPVWHRRESFGLDRWRLNTLFKWNGDWYGGDYANGNVYKLTWGYSLEGESTPLVRRLRSGVMHDNGNRVFLHGIKFNIASQPPTAPFPMPDQPDGPTITGDAPDWDVNRVYTPYQYTITPGDKPIASTVLRSGSLPPGLVMSAGGEITGTPTTVGVYSDVLRTKDTNGLFDDLADTIQIGALSMAQGETISGTPSYATSPTGKTWSALMGTPTDYLAASHNRFFAYGPTAINYTDDFGASFVTAGGYGGGGSGGDHDLGYSGSVVLIGDGITGIIRSSDGGDNFASVPYPANPRCNYVKINRDTTPLAMCASIYDTNVWLSTALGAAASWTAGGDHGVDFNLGGDMATDGLIFGLAGRTPEFDGPCVAFSADGVTFSHPGFPGSAADFVAAITAGVVDGVKTWLCGTNNGELWRIQNGDSNWTRCADDLGVPVHSCNWSGALFFAGGDNDPATGTGVIKYGTDANHFTVAATNPLLFSIADIATLQP